MSGSVSPGDRIRYQIDRFLSASPLSRFGALVAISSAITFACAALAVLLVPDPAVQEDPAEALWWALTRVLDTGTMSGDAHPGARAVGAVATLGGLLVVALLIGLTSSTIGEKIEGLRKGRSPVIDEGHTLLLGFDEKAFTILRELREANRNRRDASVVILSPREKEEVEAAVRERTGGMGNTRVIVRQGSSTSPEDLRKVGAGRARSIVVLAHEPDAAAAGAARVADVDLHAIKTVLALRRIPGALVNNHVVVELQDAARKEVLESLGGGGVEVVALRETLSRMIVQTARQHGLAQVYRDLLSYEGSEFYFRAFPELAGIPYASTQARVRGGVVAGIRYLDEGGKPAVLLNPSDGFALEATDELLVLAEDDDTFAVVPERAARVPGGFVPPPPRHAAPERVLVCGSGPSLPFILRELDRYVLPGSEAYLMAGGAGDTFVKELDEGGLGLLRLRCLPLHGDPTQPDDLRRALEAASFSIVLVLADERRGELEADARTVVSMLLLRALVAERPPPRPRIVSEIKDPRTKELLEVDDASDFVVSSEITSMLLAQISERRELAAVFQDLFDADGNEIYLKRAACYAHMGYPTPWLAVQAVARARGETALGFLRRGERPVLNPRQEAEVVFVDDDRVVVIAEDDTELPTRVASAPMRGGTVPLGALAGGAARPG